MCSLYLHTFFFLIIWDVVCCACLSVRVRVCLCLCLCLYLCLCLCLCLYLCLCACDPLNASSTLAVCITFSPFLCKGISDYSAIKTVVHAEFNTSITRYADRTRDLLRTIAPNATFVYSSTPPPSSPSGFEAGDGGRDQEDHMAGKGRSSSSAVAGDKHSSGSKGGFRSIRGQ